MVCRASLRFQSQLNSTFVGRLAVNTVDFYNAISMLYGMDVKAM